VRIPVWIKTIMVSLSNYCLGVYCIHWAVGKYVNLYLESQGYRTNTFSECLIILIISFGLAIGISKIPGRYSKQLVK